MNTQEKKEALDKLNAEWLQKDLPLKALAKNAVPGEGNPDTDILFIGEAPGKKEDEQGRPFVGAAGQLLNQLIASIGLKREEIFIANVIKHRPPGNRDPLPEEIAAYSPWLDAQIEIINPKLIVTLGRFSMDHLLGPGFSITRIHGQPKRRRDRVVFPVYHPAAALYRREWQGVLAEDFRKIPAVLKVIEKERAGKTEAEDSDELSKPEQKTLL